jgi:hypothetical protein
MGIRRQVILAAYIIGVLVPLMSPRHFQFYTASKQNNSSNPRRLPCFGVAVR